MTVPKITADQISVREVLTKYEEEFAAMARAVENGEFALWVGSGISRNAPNLGDLIERALDFLREGANCIATRDTYNSAFEEALRLANFEPADLSGQFGTPLANWPQRNKIINRLWNKYSRLLDIRIKAKPADFMLWEAVDIREAFADPAPPATEHLCIAILILEGAVDTIASANWDGFIESAIARLSPGAHSVLQVAVDSNQLRSPTSQAKLLKFHGCVIYATQDPETFRKYLTGSHTQIIKWADESMFAAMRDALVAVATHQKSLVIGLSIQDNNLQSIFSKAKQVNAWPWPCEPHAPGHVFCEDVIKEGQSDILKIVYGDAYNDNIDAIHASTHLRAWGEQALLALVLKLIADKLKKLMEIALNEANKASMTTEFAALLIGLRDRVADLVIGDRTAFTNAAITSWSRLLSLFRRGTLPANSQAYEVVSSAAPDNLEADQNALANGLGRLGLALCLLQHGRVAERWELGQAAAPETTAGALTARGSWETAPDRPLFLVKSATQAIELQRNGAFTNVNAIVVHADNAWHSLSRGGTGIRRPHGTPGRTGRVQTTHVSLGNLIEACDDADVLKERFVAEMTL